MMRSKRFDVCHKVLVSPYSARVYTVLFFMHSVLSLFTVFVRSPEHTVQRSILQFTLKRTLCTLYK